MLSAAPGIGYIHEPFHLGHRPGICAAQFDHWFTYIVKENEGPYLRPIERTLQFRYDLAAEFHAIHSSKDVARAARDWSRFNALRLRRARPLVKDPIALLSAPWLADTFGMDVIVLIRHPAAFVSSILKLNWNHPFGDFTQQPLLIRDLLSPFSEELVETQDGRGDALHRAALLWKILHYVILRYRERYPNWLFRRHEDLSIDPMLQFEQIYLALNLPFDGRVRRVIRNHTGEENPSDPRDASSTRRNSARNVWNWQRRLSPEQTATIRLLVEDVSSQFYTDDDWETTH